MRGELGVVLPGPNDQGTSSSYYSGQHAGPQRRSPPLESAVIMAVTGAVGVVESVVGLTHPVETLMLVSGASVDP